MTLQRFLSGGVIVVVLLVLAGLLLFAARRRGAAAAAGVEGGPPPEDVFVRVDRASEDSLLADWRWKVGDQAELFRVTVFGDLFTRTPDGRIHLLDVGTASYVEAAESTGQFAAAT